MSEEGETALAPCLFCHTAVHVQMGEGLVSVYSSTSGFWVTCTACGLRGPWRPGATQARTAWNWATTAHEGPEEGQEK
jgi:hypothetical protein